MMKTSSSKPLRHVESEIWNRLLPNEQPLDPAVVDWIAGLAFSPADVSRVNELAIRASEGRLSAEENSELELYERIGDLVSILKAKARKVKRPRTRGR